MYQKQYSRRITALMVLVLTFAFVFVGCRVSVRVTLPEDDSRNTGVKDWFAMVPYDYDIMPHQQSDGGLSTDYKMTFYSAEGQAKDMEFTLTTHARNQVIYPPGTYMSISTRGDQVVARGAMDSADIPDRAMAMIRENNPMPPTASLSDYAEWRTELLNTQHGEWASVNCYVVSDNVMLYSYTLSDIYSVDNIDDITVLVKSLDADYLIQYRSDYLLYPNLRSIYLFIETSDNIDVYFCEYNEYIKFAYED